MQLHHLKHKYRVPSKYVNLLCILKHLLFYNYKAWYILLKFYFIKIDNLVQKCKADIKLRRFSNFESEYLINYYF